jgi:hypothetical protein
MEKRIIVRGLLVGLLGGVLAFAFARIFAEPVIQRAIDYESGRDEAQVAIDAAAGHPDMDMGPELFTRAVQSNVGIGFGNVSPRNLALLVAGGLFLGMYLVPFLKYPANPPAVGHEETIKDRTALYLTMVVCSLVFLLGAVWLGKKLSARFGNWTATLLAAGAFIVAIGIVMVLLPSLGHLSTNVDEYGMQTTETPQPLTDPSGKLVYPGFPADDLYFFRLYSVGAQLILWTTIALCFAPMASRLFGSTSESSGVLVDSK